MEAKDILLGVVSVGAAVASGFGFYKLKKLETEINEKIDKGVETIAKACEGQIDISDTIIEEAVDKAVERNAKVAASTVIDQVHHDILVEVRSAIEEATADVSGDVKKELEKQIGELDIKDIRKSVVKKAADQAQEKFTKDLEDILEQYNKKLNDVGDIYDSIAASLKAREDKKSEGLSLKIGG